MAPIFHEFPTFATIPTIEPMELGISIQLYAMGRASDATAGTKPVQQPVQKPVQKPVQQPAKAPASNTVNASSQFAREVANLVNQERAKAGLAPLAYDAALEKVALAKAADMDQNNYFDHNSPTYGSPFDMMKRFGVSYMTAGENIAMGQRSAEEVMQQWMNSDGHRKNIMNPNFTKIGVGYQNGYWVQEFTG
ncbi:hypothetical protein BBOR36S_02477 [Brevibacillus borstelensis]